MSYEYKEEILLDIGPEPNCNYEREYNRYYDKIEELDHVYAQAPKADEYEAKNKELLEELQYLRKVNDDLVWQRDTDEEHEAKAKAFDKIVEQRKKTGVITLGHHAWKIIKEYENGEQEALDIMK